MVCDSKSRGLVPRAAGPAWMGPRRLFLAAVLFLAQAAPPEASQYCCSLEYWNPDNKCCSSCLQRFGPPPCPGEEPLSQTMSSWKTVGSMTLETS